MISRLHGSGEPTLEIQGRIISTKSIYIITNVLVVSRSAAHQLQEL
jgi:hypothetical protein